MLLFYSLLNCVNNPHNVHLINVKNCIFNIKLPKYQITISYITKHVFKNVIFLNITTSTIIYMISLLLILLFIGFNLKTKQSLIPIDNVNENCIFCNNISFNRMKVMELIIKTLNHTKLIYKNHYVVYT